MFDTLATNYFQICIQLNFQIGTSIKPFFLYYVVHIAQSKLYVFEFHSLSCFTNDISLSEMNLACKLYRQIAYRIVNSSLNTTRIMLKVFSKEKQREVAWRLFACCQVRIAHRQMRSTMLIDLYRITSRYISR